MSIERVELYASIKTENEKLAEELHLEFQKQGIFVVNVLGGAGAGKTNVIIRLAEALLGEKLWVIEGDIASDIDTERLCGLGIPAVQIRTGGTCHLNAAMIKSVLTELKPQGPGWLFIENIGNLVCPAEYLVGEHLRLVISSTPEGWDKPFKYPTIFRNSHAAIITKTDLEHLVDFDRQKYLDGFRMLNDTAPLFGVCAPRNEGFEPLVNWLKNQRNITFSR